MTSRFLHSLSVQRQGHMWLVQAGANGATVLTQSREATQAPRQTDLCAFAPLSLRVGKLQGFLRRIVRVRSIRAAIRAYAWLQGRPTNCVEDPRGDATERRL